MHPDEISRAIRGESNSRRLTAARRRAQSAAEMAASAPVNLPTPTPAVEDQPPLQDDVNSVEILSKADVSPAIDSRPVTVPSFEKLEADETSEAGWFKRNLRRLLGLTQVQRSIEDLDTKIDATLGVVSRQLQHELAGQTGKMEELLAHHTHAAAQQREALEIRLASLEAATNNVGSAQERALGKISHQLEIDLERQTGKLQDLLALHADTAAQYHGSVERRFASLEATIGNISRALEIIDGSLNQNFEGAQHQMAAHLSAMKTLIPLSESLVKQLNTTDAKITDIKERVFLYDIANEFEKIHNTLYNISNIISDIKNNEFKNIDLIKDENSLTKNLVSVYIPAIQNKIDFLLRRNFIPVNVGRSLLVQTPIGFMVIPSRDVAQIAYLSGQEIPESGTLRLLHHFLKPGDTFVDVGANLGLFSLTGGRQVAPNGSVIAIEPTPETVESLKSTILINGLAEIVEVHALAAGEHAATGKLYVAATSSWNTMIPSRTSQEAIDVKILPLDDIVGTRSVDVVKIDAEGWEIPIVAGMHRMLTRCPDIVIFLEFGISHLKASGVSADEWIEAVTQDGRDIFAIREDVAKIEPFDPNSVVGSVNVIVGRDLRTRAKEFLG